MVAAVRVHQVGGPEVLKYEEIQLKDPGPGELRIKTDRDRSKFHRHLFPNRALPGAQPSVHRGQRRGGRCDRRRQRSQRLQKRRPGRVLYSLLGAYATERNLPADRAVKLPPKIDDRTGAAMMLKGMTAQYLLRRTYKVKKGDTILVHAAAGGVGLLLCQWAKYLGATVIGTTGSKEKAELARKNGAHHTILYNEENWVARVARYYQGEKMRRGL